MAAIVAKAGFHDLRDGQTTFELFDELFDQMSDEFIASVDEFGIQMPINFHNGCVYNGQHRLVLAWLRGDKTIQAVSLGTIVRNPGLPYSAESRNA